MKLEVFHIRLTKENLQTDQEKVNEFMESVKVINTATELVSGHVNFWSIVIFYTKKSDRSSNKISYPADTEMTEEEKEIYDTLRLWRKEKALEENLPLYFVFNNSELITIVKEKPQTIEDLLKLSGFGAKKIAKYGDDIIAVLNSIRI